MAGCGYGSVTALVGQTVTVDGAAGAVYQGALPVVDAGSLDDADLAQLTEWARAEAAALYGLEPSAVLCPHLTPAQPRDSPRWVDGADVWVFTRY